MTSTEIDLAVVAERMLHDLDAHSPGTIFAEGLRLSLADAWKLQTAVANLREARGESVVGYKIGCVCEANQKANGLDHPVWGRLWSTEQHASGATLEKADFANVGIEGEFAVEIVRDIQRDETELTSLAAAIGRVYPVIELHNAVMRGEPPRGHELIANNAIHAGVVRGVGRSDLAESISTDLAVLFDGKIVDSWNTLTWPADILQALSWLVQQLAKHDKHIKQGDLILTGAFGPVLPLGEGTHVAVTSSAFGDVECTIA